MKIRARIVLTEIPIDIEMEMDSVYWLTNDEEGQCKMIWESLMLSHPLVAEVAIQNTKLYPKTSWIEDIKIVTN